MKKKLIILEGPTGSGKTSVRRLLFSSLNLKNLAIIPEFSTTDVGRILYLNSSIVKKQPEHLTGINGALIYLADKIYFIKETLRNSNSEIVIFDRFIMSQIILGQYFINDIKEANALEQSILEINDWLLDIFSEKSTIYLFDAPSEILIQRMGEKTRAGLDNRAKEYLTKTQEAYEKYNWRKLGWRIVKVDGSRSVFSIAEFIHTDIRRHMMND